MTSLSFLVVQGQMEIPSMSYFSFKRFTFSWFNIHCIITNFWLFFRLLVLTASVYFFDICVGTLKVGTVSSVILLMSLFHCVHFYLSLMFLTEKWQACFEKDRIGQGISTLISQGLISNPSATISKLYSVKLFNLFWLHFLTVRERNWMIKGVMSVGFVIINNLSYIRDTSLNISFTSDFWILLPYFAKLSHARKILSVLWP